VIPLGEPALLSYTRRGKQAKVIVKVTEVIFSVALGYKPTAANRSTVVAYKVRSPHGGELTVSPGELRPGTALDRIIDALEG
jgi:hypothetical protein